MFKILLVPAGETDGSRRSEVIGLNDLPLNRAGVDYADSVSESLRPIIIEAIFSGPLKRQQVTASHIARPHNLPVRTERALVDLNYGRWSGLSWEEVQKLDSKRFDKMNRKPQNFAFPSGDKTKRYWKRLAAFTHSLMSNYGTGNLVIVGDEFTLSMIASQISGIDFRALEPWKATSRKTTILSDEADGTLRLVALRGADWKRH